MANSNNLSEPTKRTRQPLVTSVQLIEQEMLKYTLTSKLPKIKENLQLWEIGKKNRFMKRHPIRKIIVENASMTRISPGNTPSIALSPILSKL